MVEQIYPPPHIVVQTYLYNNWPDDGSVDPRKSQILWGQLYSGQADITLIVEGGTPKSEFKDTGWTVKVNKQTVKLTAFVRDYTGNWPIQIHNMRNFIKRFIRLNHSSDELINTWNVDYIHITKISSQKMPNDSELANTYRMLISIDVIYMTKIIV